ncbi:MAG: NAD(P)H-hydrate epimerase [Candidatus Omnitrophota bacterium]
MRSKQFLTSAQAQRIDRIAITKIGIPSIVLMENAGRAAAKEIIRTLKSKRSSLKKNLVLVFCGLGNNGGDGFVIARYLSGAGIKVKVFILGSPHRLKEDAVLNYRILRLLKIPVVRSTATPSLVRRDILRSQLIVDAIFGVGLNRAINEPFFNMIKTINQYAQCVFAIDIPSGLDATTGKIHGICVNASRTITFNLPKKGFFYNDGPKYTGQIKTLSIGIPKRLFK